MLATGLKDAAHSGHERGLEHGVVEAAGLIGWAEVGGCEGVDGHGWHIVSNVLEVLADGIVWVLKCYDVNGISCQFLGDLDALLSKLEVEVVNVLKGLLI